MSPRNMFLPVMSDGDIFPGVMLQSGQIKVSLQHCLTLS